MNFEKGKIRTFLSLGLFLIAVVGLSYIIMAPETVDVEVAKVSIGPFKETIRADGVLRSKERYIVPAFADGDIRRVALKVGDTVKKGDRITDLFWEDYVPLRAPIDGVISKIFRESAGPVHRGDPIVEIVDPKRLEAMAELLTTDAVRLRPENKVWIENWSGGSPIEAKVLRISKAGFTKQSALGVEEERTEVTADLVNPPKDLLENMGSTFHVEMKFDIRETPAALKIPIGALFRDGSSWSVYTAEGGTAHKKKIEVEAFSAQEAAVKSGLQVGEQVLVYPGDLVSDGAKIRIK